MHCMVSACTLDCPSVGSVQISGVASYRSFVNTWYVSSRRKFLLQQSGEIENNNNKTRDDIVMIWPYILIERNLEKVES